MRHIVPGFNAHPGSRPAVSTAGPPAMKSGGKPGMSFGFTGRPALAAALASFGAPAFESPALSVPLIPFGVAAVAAAPLVPAAPFTLAAFAAFDVDDDELPANATAPSPPAARTATAMRMR